MSEQAKPKWREEETLHRGGDALHLCETHQAVLEARLPAGTVDGLRTDLGLLTVSGSDRKAGRTEQKGRTGKKHDAAEDGKDWVMTVRDMAQRTVGVGSGELKALGVGERVNVGSTKTVSAAISACLLAFKENPDLYRNIGLIESDLTDAEAISAELSAAGGDQNNTVLKNKDKTFDRNAVQMRIEAAVDMISSRGRMAFRNDRDIRDRFEALVSGKSLHSGSSGTEAPGDGSVENAV